MSQRAFVILLILLAVLVALSAASFPGAMIGFLFGITAAFFIAIPGATIGDALHRHGRRTRRRMLYSRARGQSANIGECLRQIDVVIAVLCRCERAAGRQRDRLCMRRRSMQLRLRGRSVRLL